jgi:DNA-binding response OmpR family regulator
MPTSPDGSSRGTILVVSHDNRLADIRRNKLESAGFRVLQAMDIRAIAEACENNSVDLVMIGYSLPPAEKRRAWVEARRACKVPILELYTDERPHVLEASYFHRSAEEADFLSVVEDLLSK